MKIVYVDFDETLVASKSYHYLYFIRKNFKSQLWFFIMLLLSPLLILTHYVNAFLRDRVWNLFYRGIPDVSIRTLARSFFQNNPQLLHQEVVNYLRMKKQDGYKIVIVSGSVTQIIHGALDAFMLNDLFDQCLGTELGFRNGSSTGFVKGHPVIQGIKVRSIQNFEQKLSVTERIVITDSPSDLPMLNLGSHCILVNPGSKLREHARVKAWEIWNTIPQKPINWKCQD